jgi:hypothetical protein
MKSNVSSIYIALLVLVIVTACGKLDVVGADSARAFGEVLKVLPPDDAGYGWSISAPLDSALFVWRGERASISFDASPFIEAGLDTSKLSNINDGKIVFTRDFQKADIERTNPLEDYRRIVSIARNAIGYHAALDHYNIDLGGGNMFEWAKDMGTNDKDIVFVLNPAPFIEAGVDPNAIDGWVYTKVPSMDANGKEIEVDKILKAFDLK